MAQLPKNARMQHGCGDMVKPDVHRHMESLCYQLELSESDLKQSQKLSQQAVPPQRTLALPPNQQLLFWWDTSLLLYHSAASFLSLVCHRLLGAKRASLLPHIWSSLITFPSPLNKIPSLETRGVLWYQNCFSISVKHGTDTQNVLTSLRCKPHCSWASVYKSNVSKDIISWSQCFLGATLEKEGL